MKKYLLSLGYLLSTIAFSQNLNKSSLDSLFTYMNQQEIGAGSVSILKNGKEVYSNSFGNRDYENNLTNNKETKFRIGSITKTFTATLIMKMIENKKLSLNDKLSKFYPEVINADKITIKNLLQHSSGINNITNNKDFFDWYLQDFTKQQLLKKIYLLKSDFEPGNKEEYSNTNYMLLSFILEDVSNKTYQELVEKIIIKPLKLSNTKVGGKILENNNEAKSYNYYNDTYNLLPESSMTIPLGAGFMVSTPSDLNTFMYSLLQGKIVSKNCVIQMTNFQDQFGFGLLKDEFNNEKGIGHGGIIDGFLSYTYCFDETNLCYSIIQNVKEIPQESIKQNLFNATHNLKIKYPKKVISLKLSDEIINKYYNEYTSQEVPISIKFYSENNVLMAQGTGQSAFPLTAISNSEFEFNPAKIRIEFSNDGTQMKLIQNGKSFNFIKK